MGVVAAFTCFFLVYLGAMIFELFTILLANATAKSIHVPTASNSEPMGDEGYIYSAMYLSMHDE